MTSPHVVGPVENSFVLYGCMKQIDFDDQMRLPDRSSRLILPDRRSTYVGLRTDVHSALERMKVHSALERRNQWIPQLQRSEILTFKVEFTDQGFDHYSAQATGTIPLLQRMVYPVQPSKDGSDFDVYHFNEPLPFQMHTGAGEELLNVTFFRACEEVMKCLVRTTPQS